jgi:hypothetical protein
MLFLYLMPTMGIHVMVHLCGEKVSAISLGWKNSKCECETKKTKGNCCEDKVAFFKIKDEHQKIPDIVFQVFKEKAVQIFSVIQYTLGVYYYTNYAHLQFSSHPPSKLKQSLYLVLQVIRI